MRADRSMSDDALIERGAECELALEAIARELHGLQGEVYETERRLRKPVAKFAANLAIGGLGLALAPPTFGWSLLLTVGSTVMLLWDSADMTFDYSRYRAIRRHLRDLRVAATEYADELAEIAAILEERYPRPD